MVVPIPIGGLSYTATGSDTTRTIADRGGDVVNVLDFGAVGDGIEDDTAALQAALDYAYGQLLPAGSNMLNWHLNKPVFIPAGVYKITAPLTIKWTWGAHVFGAGMIATTIRNETEDEAVLILDGVGYSKFDNFALLAAGGGTGCDWTWNWPDGPSVGLASQLCVFEKMQCSSTGGQPPALYGFKVGFGGHQCDTSSWIDCTFGADVGISVSNLNAISNRIVGGNLQSCRIGIEVIAGAFQTIHGVGFQLSVDADIWIKGGGTDAYSITSVSTESTNFVRCSTLSVAIVITGCAQRSSTVGIFAEGQSVLHIEGCQSKAGRVDNSGRNTTIVNSSFWQMDALPTTLDWEGATWLIQNSFFGIDEGSVARREIDTIISKIDGVLIKRTRGIEGTSLTATRVVNEGIYTSANAIVFSPIIISVTNPVIIGAAAWDESNYDSPHRHGFVEGTAIAFKTTGALPTSLAVDTAYFVIATGLTTTTFSISATPGGAAISTASQSQSGVHSIYLVRMFTAGDQIWKSNPAASTSPGWICTAAGHSIAGGGAGTFKTMAPLGA